MFNIDDIYENIRIDDTYSNFALMMFVSQNNTLDMNERDHLNIEESRYHRRMKLMLRALFAICGEALRNCFLSQQILVKVSAHFHSYVLKLSLL